MAFWDKWKHKQCLYDPREDFQNTEQYNEEVEKCIDDNVSKCAIDFLDWEYGHPHTSYKYEIEFPTFPTYSPVKRQNITDGFILKLANDYGLNAIKYDGHKYEIERV